MIALYSTKVLVANVSGICENDDLIGILPNMAGKNTVFQQKLSVNIRGNLFDLRTPRVMGILNLTPDSFYDGGKYNNLASALKNVETMLSEGADLIDMGAYSSRPGAPFVTESEEYSRLIPVVGAVRSEFPSAILSIDTFRSGVAEQAVNEGADMINDISGGELDPDMFVTVAKLRVPYVLMHMRGTPQDMAEKTGYLDITADLCRYFAQKISRLKDLGLVDLIIDPGFGFAKTLAQNYELLDNLGYLRASGHPTMAAISRKSMIYKLLETDAENALEGTTAAHAIAILRGANVLRAHDVKAAKEVIKIVSAVNASNSQRIV